MPNSTCMIGANADIAGIGVRVSVYLQVLLSVMVTSSIFVNHPALALDDPHDKVEKGQMAQVGEPGVQDNLSGVYSRKMVKILHEILKDGFTSQITSAAIILSAIIQAKALSLSTYHALIALNLSWLLMITVASPICVVFSYTTPKQLESKLRGLLYILQSNILLKGVFGLWIFGIPKSFDTANDEACALRDKVTFYMFGHYAHPGTRSFRNFWIVIYALTIYGGFTIARNLQWLFQNVAIWHQYVERTLFGLRERARTMRDKLEVEAAVATMIEARDVRQSSEIHREQDALALESVKDPGSTSMPVEAQDVHMREAQEEKQEQRIRGAEARSAAQKARAIEERVHNVEKVVLWIHKHGMATQIGLYSLVISILLIVCTELTINANAELVGSEDGQWSFGQTLALFLILPNAYSALKRIGVLDWVLRQGSIKDEQTLDEPRQMLQSEEARQPGSSSDHYTPPEGSRCLGDE